MAGCSEDDPIVTTRQAGFRASNTPATANLVRGYFRLEQMGSFDIDEQGNITASPLASDRKGAARDSDMLNRALKLINKDPLMQTRAKGYIRNRGTATTTQDFNVEGASDWLNAMQGMQYLLDSIGGG